jgi:exosortase/archaeosortase family protein
LFVSALPRFDPGRAAFAAAILVLAAGPIIWLINTWLDPAFDSHGFVYFIAVATLAAWSLSSERQAIPGQNERIAVLLLSATALIRLIAQVSAIDTIGALALVIDVYALARLAGLQHRSRALSPFWLAVAFAFALPLERIVQRSIGFLLQDVSAQGACVTLAALFGDVECAGVRITVEGADVLVDLPCSGARALIMFGFAFAIAATLARPRLHMALVGAAIALAAALVGNVIRITLLASGVAIGPEALGFDVMAQPWHDLVGLIALGAAAPVLFIWARRVRSHVAPVKPSNASCQRSHLWRAGAFLIAAIAIVSAPRTPLDITPRDVSIAAPERIGAHRAMELPLTNQERAYFEQFGGAAVKAAYGPNALMLARTTSPLRHLHAPDECLRGLGYRVSYLGMRFAPTPTAQYRAVDPEGRAFRVEVSFLSDRGHRVASVSEAVWIWLNNRSTVWTAVQRITPEHAADHLAFDAGVFAALDQPTLTAAGGNHAR